MPTYHRSHRREQETQGNCLRLADDDARYLAKTAAIRIGSYEFARVRMSGRMCGNSEPYPDNYGSDLCLFIAPVIATTSGITQLTQSNQICQLCGERRVFRINPTPVVSALRTEALRRYSRIAIL